MMCGYVVRSSWVHGFVECGKPGKRYKHTDGKMGVLCREHYGKLRAEGYDLTEVKKKCESNT